MKVPRNFAAPAVPGRPPLWRRLQRPLTTGLLLVALLVVYGFAQHLDMRSDAAAAREATQRERALRVLSEHYRAGVDDGYAMALAEAASNHGCAAATAPSAAGGGL